MICLLHFHKCGNTLLKTAAMAALVVVDEQLVLPGDWWRFRQHVPTKLDKYRMTLFLLCDCLTGYTFNTISYIECQANHKNVGLTDDVKFPFKSLHFSIDNIITDKSIPVPSLLLTYFTNKPPC